MADINLLQSQLKDTTKVSTFRTKLVVWICFILLLAAAGAGGVLYYLTQKTNANASDVASSNTQLRSQLETKQQGLQDAQAYQAQLSNISLLLKNHIYFSPIVDELASATYQKALYTVFDVAQDTGKVHIEGIVDSYSGLGKLLLGLSTSKNFQNVKLLSVGQAVGAVSGVDFAIDMATMPNSFRKLP